MVLKAEEAKKPKQCKSGTTLSIVQVFFNRSLFDAFTNKDGTCKNFYNSFLRKNQEKHGRKNGTIKKRKNRNKRYLSVSKTRKRWKNYFEDFVHKNLPWAELDIVEEKQRMKLVYDEWINFFR